MRSPGASKWAWCVALSLLAGCGGQAFRAGFEERADPAFTEALTAIASAPAREEAPVVVAIADDPRRLIVYDLDAREVRFTVEADVDVALAAGDYVVSREGERIVVRSLEDGAEILELDARELSLIGADGHGRTLVITAARGEGHSPSGVVYGVVDGAAAWGEELPLPVGVPAVAGDLVIVPWATQRVSILDAETGREVARHRMEDSVVGHAFAHRGAYYLGQHGVFRVRPSLAGGTRESATYYEPAGRPLPGQPPLLRDGYEPLPPAESARHRLRLVWAPSGDGDDAIGFVDDRLYYVFYRIVFAMEADADAVRWARLYPRDVVGAAAGAGGLLVVGENGDLQWLAAEDGGPSFEASLGTDVRVADVRLAGFTPPAQPEASEADAEGDDAEDAAEAEAPAIPDDLQGQLALVAAADDPRLGGGRALAVRYLARFDDEETTAALIELCSARGGVGPARDVACEAVATRTSGAQHVRSALTGSASFLEDRPAPPVGALARAAAGMNLRITVPHLVRHLEDPATEEGQLEGLFTALGELGDARAVEPIETYLQLYHADTAEPGAVQVLGAAAEALLALDEPRAERLLRGLIDDPLAPVGVQERLERAMVNHQALADQANEPDEEADETPAEAPEEVDERPERITNDIRVEVFEPRERELRVCLASGEGVPVASARLGVVVGRDGTVRAVHVAPRDLTECMEPIVRALRFPVTQRGGEAIVHVVRR